jgi:steroid 5-alpha reductase family enzyme
MKRAITRKESFIIVSVIYVLASVAGIVTYILLPELWPFWARLLLSDILATVVTFIFSLIFKNASVYDPYWSVQPIVTLLAFAVASKLTLLKLLLLLAVLLWGIRLTANWAYTFKSLRHEDWRYVMLQEKTGPLYPIVNFVGIHMVPTLVVYLCTLPAVAVMLGNARENVISYFAIALSLGAATLQGFADVQMHRFRKRGTSGFIREGLWKNCRHPNYLGEILMWWGVGICSVASLGVNYLFLLIGALANTALFLFVSIPLAEGKQSKKEGYAEYKAQTRALLPIPKN